MSSISQSKQPRKQRKAMYNAPLHVRRKRIACHLSDDLIKRYNRRSATVRLGDTVKIVRGADGVVDHTAKVIGVNTDTGRLALEGLTIPKADGKLIPRYIHASNCVITRIDTTDPFRVKKLGGAGGEAPARAESTPSRGSRGRNDRSKEDSE